MTRPTGGGEQPEADATCVACGHPGSDHIGLLGMPPHCHCGCIAWEPADE